MNIQFINLVLYILQIGVISFGIFIGYKNYKELMRKNNIEEAPYLGITQTQDFESIELKNFGKTPIKVEKIIFIDELHNGGVFVSDMPFNIPNFEIMPGEIKQINIKENLACDLAEETPGIRIIYFNHISRTFKDYTIKHDYKKYITVL